MKPLPKNAKSKNSSPLFTAKTLPQAIQTWHQTGADIWAKIVLSKGTALYEIDTEPNEKVELSPTVDGIIEPQQSHRLSPSDDAEIQIFFYIANNNE